MEKILLALTVVVLPFASLSGSNSEYTAAKFYLAGVFSCVLLGFVFFRILKDKSIPKNEILIAVAVFLLAGLLSTKNAVNSQYGVAEYLRYFLNVSFFFFVVILFNKPGDINKVFFLLLIGSIIPAFYGIKAFMEHPNAPLTSCFSSNNYFGTYLDCVIPFVFAGVIFYKNTGLKIFSGILLSVLLICLIASKSRAAWTGFFFFVLFCAVYLIVYLKSVEFKLTPKRLAVFAVIVLIALGLSGFLAVKRVIKTEQVFTRVAGIFNKNDISNKHRILMWYSTMDLIRNSPLFGNGYGGFFINYPKEQSKYLATREFSIFRTRTDFAHNEFLQFWAETGTIGLGIFLWLIATVFTVGMRNFNSNPQVVFAGLGSIFAVLVNSLFTHPFHIETTSAYFWIAVGMVASSCGKADDEVIEVRTNPAKYFYLAIVAVALTLVAVALAVVVIALLSKPVGSMFLKQEYSAVAEGDYEKFFQVAGKHYSIDNNDLYNLQLLAMTERKNGNADGALFYYERATRLYPYFAELRNNFGVLLVDMGEKEFALNQYKLAEKIEPSSPLNKINVVGAYNTRVAEFIKSGDYRKAVSLCRVVLIKYPDNAGAHRNMGIIHFDSGDFENAKKEFRKATELDPSNARYRLDLALTHEKTGDIIFALTEYRSAQKISANDPYIEEQIGRLEHR